LAPPRALFFDIGNTLVADPFSLAIPAVAEDLIARQRLPLSKRDELLEALHDANTTLDGLGWSHFWGEYDIMEAAIRSVLGSADPLLVEGSLRTYREEVRNLYRQREDMLALSPPTLRNMLLRMRRAGLVIGLISDEREQNIPRYLEVLEAKDLFDVVVTSESVGVAKPAAAIFLAALERTGHLAGEAVYVGNDYSRDVEGGRAVGMRVVYFVRFNASPPDQTERADLVTDNLLDVISFAEMPS